MIDTLSPLQHSSPSSAPLGRYDSAANVDDLDALIAGKPPLPKLQILGYARDDADRMAQIVMRFAALLIRAHPFLSFDALECMVIGADYRTALSLYEEEGRAFDKDFCDSATTSLGIVLPTQRGVVTFIHPQVIDQLQADSPQSWASAIRVFWHELCHIHDVGLRRNWLLRRARTRQEDGILYRNCDGLWAEYFANRFSYFNGADLSDDWRRLELLLEHMPRMEPALAADKLASTFGYLLGSLAAQRTDLHRLRPDLVQRLRMRGLMAAWLEACTATDDLIQSQDCWHHEKGVMRLAIAARLIENACRFGSR